MLTVQMEVQVKHWSATLRSLSHLICYMASIAHLDFDYSNGRLLDPKMKYISFNIRSIGQQIMRALRQ